MFLANDHAAFDSDLEKLAGWADIGQNLLCGFAQRREYRKLRQHGEPCREVVGVFYPELGNIGRNGVIGSMPETAIFHQCR
jgi:Zn ribbon nucleic-acid-binding protein